MKNAIAAIDVAVDAVEKVVIFVVYMALVACLFFQVLSRFVLETPLDFTEELSRVLLVWLVFVGAARGLAKAEHFIVDAVVALLPRALAAAAGYLVDIVCVAFMLAICWISYRTSFAGAGETLPAMRVSIIVQSLAMPVGFTLMLWHAFSLIMRRLHVGEPEPLGQRADALRETGPDGAP